MENKNYYSKHTFMFPFQWDYVSKTKSALYNQRTNLDDFDRLFSEIGLLKKTSFAIGADADKYSEYTYFHPFVRQALFYRNDDDILRYYELDEPNGEFVIEHFKGYSEEIDTLALILDSVCMHVYDTGVGVLSFNLTNDKYNNPDAILAINEYGRRLYPQFMTPENRLETKKSFLANKIHGEIGELKFSDDFSAYNVSIDTDASFLPPDHILKIFGYRGQEKIGDTDKSFVFTKEAEHKNSIRIRQITDDRMFFLCWYGNNQIANALKNTSDQEFDDEYLNADDKKVLLEKLKNTNEETVYSLHPFWYAFIYGDKKYPSIQDSKMQCEHVKKATYTRWLDYKTLFAVTRDSFVCLSDNKTTLEANYAPPIYNHMQTMYYQMAVLCLVQRASILRFSYEITEVTKQVFDRKVNAFKPIKEMYENYIEFINNIYFREVTSQIQGIEMYTKFQEAMNLEKDIKDLDGEMEELFHYLDIVEQRELNKTANLFLPIAIITAFFGINTFVNESVINSFLESKIKIIGTTIGDIISFILIGWILYVMIISLKRKKRKK